MDIITCHLNADFDAFSSMVAASRLYPGAWLVFPGSQEKKVRDFIAGFPFARMGIRKLREVVPGETGRLIVVDACSAGRLGPLAGLLSRPGVEVHVYDHHLKKTKMKNAEGGIKGTLEHIEPVGATVTILIELLARKNIKPTPLEASLMGLGIYEETGGLLFPSTTERDILAMARVFKWGASTKIISKYMKTDLFPGRREAALLVELLENSRDIIVGGVRVRLAKAATEDFYAGDAAQLAHHIMDAEDMDALLMMVSMKGKIVVVGRSRAPEIDVAGVLAELGGGGHRYAASATIADMPLEVLEEKVEAAVKRHVRPELIAGDVMTRPVVTIDWTATLAQAGKAMTMHGVNVLPVVRDGGYAGIISREVVEKALFHGFAGKSVIDFTMTEAATVTAATPIGDVESAMVERNQRFMPVLNEEGGLEGAITRTDILRVLYEEYLRRRSQRHPEAEAGGKEREKEKEKGHLERLKLKNLAGTMKEKFPESVAGILRLAGLTAREMGFQAYIAGGSVRDLLMGERVKIKIKNLDIDLVIEGDAIDFAKRFAVELGEKTRLRSHEKFRTATLTADDIKMDVATARTEYYETPAALPTVALSSIKRDLYRRDFTINALAVKLDPEDFGALVDFFGGRRDIREKTIRVLHDLSFIEDPTRAFRAVRFAVRFGFNLSAHTEELLKSTLEMGLFDRLSGARLYEELCLIFKETEPVLAIKKLQGYGLMKVLHPSLKESGAALAQEKTFQAVHDALLWYGLSFADGQVPDRPALYLMALLSGLDEHEAGAALRRLQASEKVSAAVAGGISRAKDLLANRLPPATLEDPAGIYDAMRPLSLESLLLALSLAASKEHKRAVTRYLLELRKVKPSITGRDLVGLGFAPGPVFSRIFTALMHEKLKGGLESRQDEVRFVKAHFKPSTSCIS